jgi:hypothetical protein
MAEVLHVSFPDFEEAIRVLSSKDPDSSSPEHEGRRLEKIDGGWLILNYTKYRSRAVSGEGSRAPYYRAWRAKRKEQKAAIQADVRKRTAPDLAAGKVPLLCQDCDEEATSVGPRGAYCAEHAQCDGVVHTAGCEHYRGDEAEAAGLSYRKPDEGEDDEGPI